MKNFNLEYEDENEIYFYKGNGMRTSETMFTSVSHANTNTQIHKYSLGQSCSQP